MIKSQCDKHPLIHFGFATPVLANCGLHSTTADDARKKVLGTNKNSRVMPIPFDYPTVVTTMYSHGFYPKAVGKPIEIVICTFGGGDFNVVGAIKFNAFSTLTIICPFCPDQFGVIAIFGNIFCRFPFTFIKEPNPNNGIFIKLCQPNRGNR